ncbi:MAG: hypothetical protein NZ927_06870 [Candidatus Calescibacterium sp.]|nr:hypothetical protein [Candidatus Calescibacterium sp.]
MEYDLFREAIERGMKEGRKEGRKEGLKEGLELTIKSMFGIQSRKPVGKLRKIEDIDKLKEIAKKLPKIKSIKELEKIL